MNTSLQEDDEMNKQTLVCASNSFAHMSESSALTALKRETLPGRLELPTLRLTASRSDQLSYGSY
jgi:hypothetical protein